MRGAWLCRVSDQPDRLGLGALRGAGDVELDPLVLRQRPISVTLDCVEVKENVATAIVRADEAEALLSVDPLHRSLCHGLSSFGSKGGRAPYAPAGHVSTKPAP